MNKEISLKHDHSSLVSHDEEKLKITFFCLVIRTSSINDRYGSVEDFVEQNSLHAVMNRDLLILKEMMSPGYNLMNFASSTLPELGMANGTDYLFVEEQLQRGVGDRITELLNKEIPECEEVSWLDSKITTEGNFVWFNEVNHKII